MVIRRPTAVPGAEGFWSVAFLDAVVRTVTEISLLDRWAVTTAFVVVAAAFLVLLLRGTDRFRRRGIPIAAGITAVILVLAKLTQTSWWKLPDELGFGLYLSVGVGILGAALAIARGVTTPSGSRRRMIPLLVLAAAASVLFAAFRVNLHFEAYPTIGALAGRASWREVSFEEVRRSDRVFDETPLASRWKPTGAPPTTGAVATKSIPGTRSGFGARDAKIYLPPAYFAEPRPLLPVLVMMAGQPGSPSDWLVGGKLARTMDAFAAEHGGLAPVVVVVDATGSQWGNPLCVDSPLGRADTYLSVDVPRWISEHLQVTNDHSRWGIGGLSLGGTCSLQQVVAHPDVYRLFINLSGQREPTLGNHADTVAKVFGGDEDAFRRHDPYRILGKKRFDGVRGAFVAGDRDHGVLTGLEELQTAARKAGMKTHLTKVPGGHDFGVWSRGLAHEVPWFARETGITAPEDAGSGTGNGPGNERGGER